ncbi:MAG: hypothetical protein IJH65_03805 [Methanobrevibacter sp.]|nr:hypothetical protein [Methanobrevibacter sp.]
MDFLKFYSPDDFGSAVSLLVRNGYQMMTWAELDQNNNIVYLVRFIQTSAGPETVEPEKPERQILNEELNENGSQE